MAERDPQDGRDLATRRGEAALRFFLWGAAVTVVVSTLGLFLPSVPVPYLVAAWWTVIVAAFSFAFWSSRRQRRKERPKL